MAANGTSVPLASLSSLLDKKVLAILRDGRKLIGLLRSYDQFANLVFQDTVERVYASNMFADIPRGVFLIRGENLVFLGEITPEREWTERSKLRGPIPVEDLMVIQRMELEKREKLQKIKDRILTERGYSVEMEYEAY